MAAAKKKRQVARPGAEEHQQAGRRHHQGEGLGGEGLRRRVVRRRVGPKASSPQRPPSAKPTASDMKVSRAPASRELPEARWRMASSETAVVRVRPGISTTSADTVTIRKEVSACAAAALAAKAAIAAASASKTRPVAGRLSTSWARRPISQADRRRRGRLEQAAAEEAGGGGGRAAESQHGEQPPVAGRLRRGRRDLFSAACDRQLAVQHPQEDRVELRKLLEVHLARLEPQQDGVRRLAPATHAGRPERGEDRGRGAEELAIEAELRGDAAHRLLEPVGRAAVAVQLARQEGDEGLGLGHAGRGGARLAGQLVASVAGSGSMAASCRQPTRRRRNRGPRASTARA